MEATLVSPAVGSWAKEDMYEYTLVVHPDYEANKKIIEEKHNFYDQYLHQPVNRQKAHITLASFSAKEEMENTISRYLERICNQQQAFTVTLNNYSGFPPNSIFLRVQDRAPFKQLVKEFKAIDDYVSACSCPSVRFTENPHVSITNKIPEPVYLKAMMDYSSRTFHQSFMVNELMLFKRIKYSGESKCTNVFRLKPNTVN